MIPHFSFILGVLGAGGSSTPYTQFTAPAVRWHPHVHPNQCVWRTRGILVPPQRTRSPVTSERVLQIDAVVP